jgi:hypothetical protein
MNLAWRLYRSLRKGRHGFPAENNDEGFFRLA